MGWERRENLLPIRFPENVPSYAYPNVSKGVATFLFRHPDRGGEAAERRDLLFAPPLDAVRRQQVPPLALNRFGDLGLRSE